VIVGVLQARCSSTRFPGKVIADLHGAPMIVRQVERLRRVDAIERLVIATSVDPSDDPLVEAAGVAGIEVRRGPLDDVVGRFGVVVDEFRPDHVVRLTADCPLADPGVIAHVIEEHLSGGTDYTSNVLTPTYPDGLDVEVITAGAFARLRALALTEREREHVTLGLYGRPELFTLRNVEQRPDRSSLRWTVDIPDDLVFVREIYDRLYDENPGFAQADILDLLTRHPELARTDSDMARNAGLGS
jgi:spore coat polysaccharide biosynthesis protein SpsF